MKLADCVLARPARDKKPEPGLLTPRVQRDLEVLNLQPGDLVEVKSADEILQTLDGEGKLHGLGFLPGMWDYCGKRFTVFKRLQTHYDEQTREVRKIKNTVLLSGVHCDGLSVRCDRSCLLYWREAWLRRVKDE